MKRNGLSIGIVLLFWLFCIASVGTLIETYVATKTHWEEEVEEARQHNTSPRSSFVQSIKQGVFDTDGSWIHTEESYIPNNTIIMKVKSTFKNGKLDGERIYYDVDGVEILRETYKNGVLVKKRKSKDITVSDSHVEQLGLTKTYKILMQERPWFISDMLIFGCSSAGLDSFFSRLEKEIEKKNPKSDGEFFGAYSDALETLFSQSQFASIDNAYVSY